MNIEKGSGIGVNVSGIVYERRWVTSKKWVAGTNAGGILLSEPIEMYMSLQENFENSRLGQIIIRKARSGRQTAQKS